MSSNNRITVSLFADQIKRQDDVSTYCDEHGAWIAIGDVTIFLDDEETTRVLGDRLHDLARDIAQRDRRRGELEFATPEEETDA
jgi:hypothetical protein